MDGETASRFVEARLDRPGLTTDDGRDVALTEIGVVAKDDDDSQVGGEVLQRRHHVTRQRHSPDGVFDRGDVVQIVVGPPSIPARASTS